LCCRAFSLAVALGVPQRCPTGEFAGHRESIPLNSNFFAGGERIGTPAKKIGSYFWTEPYRIPFFGNISKGPWNLPTFTNMGYRQKTVDLPGN
jgi:hypothetical protein